MLAAIILIVSMMLLATLRSFVEFAFEFAFAFAFASALVLFIHLPRREHLLHSMRTLITPAVQIIALQYRCGVTIKQFKL